MPGVRREMHAGASAGRDDGFKRGRMRGILPLPADAGFDWSKIK